MKLSTKFTTTLDGVIKIPAVFGIIILVGAWLSVSFDVIMRYFFNRPQAWVVEVTEYILMASTFLGTAWVLKLEKHITIDVGANQLNPWSQELLKTATSILCGLACLVITWYGVAVTLREFQGGFITEGVMGIPTAPLLVFIPIGFLLLSIQFMRRTYASLKKWKALAKKR